MRVIESGVQWIWCERRGVITIQLDEGIRELASVGMLRSELVRFELVLARPPGAERREEERERREHKHEQEQCRVRRGRAHAERRVERGPARERAEHCETDEAHDKRERQSRAHVVELEMPKLVCED